MADNFVTRPDASSNYGVEYADSRLKKTLSSEHHSRISCCQYITLAEVALVCHGVDSIEGCYWGALLRLYDRPKSTNDNLMETRNLSD